MIFLVTILLNWSEIVRLLNLRERQKGIGDGTVEGHNYTVMQRDNQIYLILPDYPRKKCEDIVRRLLQKLKPDAEIKVSSIGYASSHCNYCLAPFPLTYRCQRCRGWYCNDHRFPEKHNCPGENGRTASRFEKRKDPSQKKVKEKRKEEIVAVRLPCA